MAGATGWLPVEPRAGALSFASVGVTEPSAVLDAPGPIRGLAAFLLVSAVGGLLLWRYEAFVGRSIEASMTRPLSSLGYGAAAHAVIAFAGLYLTTRLAQFVVYGQNVGIVGVLAGVLLVVLAGALGFTVVGSTLVEYGWEPRPWLGLLVGALIAGAAGSLGLVAGGVLWFVVVSMGIGGPTRRWLHADVTSEHP